MSAREEKEKDKTFSKEQNTYHMAAFDLEAVLPVSCSLVNQAYYKRKLSCYNLSVFHWVMQKANAFYGTKQRASAEAVK